jgi:hypothetical protein
MVQYSKNVAVTCVLALSVLWIASAAAVGQSSEKVVTPPVATVFLQNVSPANLGLAAVLVKTQEFGAKVALRAEATKLPADLRTDINDHLGKYVTVQMPPPYEARLLAFEVRGCTKDAAGTLASAVAATFLAKLAENRVEGNMDAVKATTAELEARQADREKLTKEAAALKPADIPNFGSGMDYSRSGIQGLLQDQMKLQSAKQQAAATLDMLKKKDAQAVPQVRAALETDSILTDLRHQKDAIVYSTTAAKDPDAEAKMITVIDGKIAQRTKDLVQAKLEAIRADAQDQLETAEAQLLENQERLQAARAAAKGVDEILQKIQAIREQESTLNQVITRLEEQLAELRVKSDSGQDTPKILGKSIGE